MTEKTDSRLPDEGEYVRGVGTVVSLETYRPEPPPPECVYVFEQIEARKELRHNGEVIQCLETLWDFYGLETSVEAAIKEMKDYAAQKGIGPKSDLEAVVVKIVSQQCATAEPRKQNFYDSTFVGFEDRRPLPNLPEPVESVVWSSRHSSHPTTEGEDS